MIIPTLALAVMLGAAHTDAAKSENFDPAQKLQTTCNMCHKNNKHPLTADGLKGKSLEKMKGHIEKKGKLTADQAAAMIQYLESIRDGKAAK